MTIATSLIPLLQATALSLSAPSSAADSTADRPVPARAGRHGIELGVGIAGGSSASVTSGTGVATVGASTDVTGSIAYFYWLAERTAVFAKVGVQSADATVSAGSGGSTIRSVTVVPLLFGVKYQPLAIRSAPTVRPYVSAAVGPFIGTDSNVGTQGGTATVGSRTEAALGGRVGIGLDVLLSRRIALGLGAGYRLMTDFEEPIGGDRNYGGADFILSFGILLGSGR